MGIKIEAKRIKMYKIKDVRALEYDELPNEYMEGTPRVYMSKKYKRLTVIYNVNGKEQVAFIRMDSMVSEYDLTWLMEIVELAGDRLHKINHTNDNKTDKKDNGATELTGTYTFEA